MENKQPDNIITVTIADDHEIMRLGLRRILSVERMIQVVGDAADGEEAIALAQIFTPDVAIIDINMPRIDGIQAARTIKQMLPATKVVILSAHEDYFHLTKALSAGADGYLSKEVGAQELIDAIYAVTRSERVFSRSILTLLNNLYPAKPETLSDPVILTRREQEILDLIAKSLTSHEIAERINLSSRTVETHRYNLINKLGVKNTAGLVRFAMMRNGPEEMNKQI